MYTTYGLVFRRVAGMAVATALMALLLPATAAASQAPEATSGEPALVRTAASLARSAATPLSVGAGYQRVGVAPQTVKRQARRVKALQRLLTRQGARPGPVDGLYGPLTEAGVARFQRKRGIAVDGIAGRQTARRLLAATRRASTDDTRRAASARLPQQQVVTVRAALDTDENGIGVSLSHAAAPGQEEEVEPGMMLALALPLLLASALFGALRGRVAPARKPERNGTLHQRVRIPERDTPQPAVKTPSPARVMAKGERREAVRAIGYVSAPRGVRMDEIGLQRQIQAIAAASDARGWDLLEIVSDVEPEGGRAAGRPGLARALGRVQAGEATCVVVYALPQLSLAVAELGEILRSVGGSGGRFVSLEENIDTAHPAGRKAANVIVSVSGWERDRLGEATRKGLAAARAKGTPISRPSVSDVPPLKERIAEMRADGMTLQAIADALNDEGVPTLRGGQKWRPSSVQAAVGYRRPKKGPA